eukprot:GHVQ01011361.1.p2 GENE.GHVQ01011361.1~~GHVQ01011361.1.p2  ORF type:complete len:203 (+),score=33.91 GHVQ01011361.1:1158-1766(+)
MWYKLLTLALVFAVTPSWAVSEATADSRSVRQLVTGRNLQEETSVPEDSKTVVPGGQGVIDKFAAVDTLIEELRDAPFLGQQEPDSRGSSMVPFGELGEAPEHVDEFEADLEVMERREAFSEDIENSLLGDGSAFELAKDEESVDTNKEMAVSDWDGVDLLPTYLEDGEIEEENIDEEANMYESENIRQVEDKERSAKLYLA